MKEQRVKGPARQTETAPKGGQLARLSGVEFSTYDHQLFYDVNVTLHRNEVTMVTGGSSVGKSVLCKILTGGEQPGNGTISFANDVQVSYVPQNTEDLNVDADITVKDLFWKSRGLDTVDREMRRIEAEMSDNYTDVLGEAYSKLQEEHERKGGYTADSEMGKILKGLKLDKESTGHITEATSLHEMSSGQRTRMLIGQALFGNADLLVLDDPTSHLDIESIDWLSEYLKASDQTVVVATTNIPFMNACATKILGITDVGRVISFEGSYDEYIEKRDRLLEAEQSEADAVRSEMNRVQATVDEFRGTGVFKKSAKMAARGRAMDTRIGRLDDKLQQLPGSQHVYRDEKVSLRVFNAKERSGNDVVFLSHPMKEYGDYLAVDLSDTELTVRRKELLLISGENGSGKSTLMRMIAGVSEGNDIFAPDVGEVVLGTGVRAAYYSQDHTGIAATGNVFEEILSVDQVRDEGKAAAILNYWGFPRGIIRQSRIEHLSAGEKKQLALAKIMAQEPNLLLLDEPTEYLNERIVDRLIAALEGFNGTTLLISHNPDFKAKIAVHRELKMPEGQLVLHRDL